LVSRNGRRGTPGASASASTMIGAAALRFCAVTRLRPMPSHWIGFASPRSVSTRSPSRSVSTGTSPDGVAMRVPAQKHGMVLRKMSVPLPLSAS
jgi:hypothetical protein